MYDLNMIKRILDEGIEKVLNRESVSPMDKLQCIEALTTSFIAVVKDFRFIHTLKRDDF